MSGDMETLVERLLARSQHCAEAYGCEEYLPMQKFWLDYETLSYKAASAIQALIAERDDLRRAIATPEAVIANMKRGGIALPSLRYLIDLYGDEALAKWDRSEASEARAKELEKALDSADHALMVVQLAIDEDTTALNDCLWVPERFSPNESVLDFVGNSRAALRNVKETGNG